MGSRRRRCWISPFGLRPSLRNPTSFCYKSLLFCELLQVAIAICEYNFFIFSSSMIVSRNVFVNKLFILMKQSYSFLSIKTQNQCKRLHYFNRFLKKHAEVKHLSVLLPVGFTYYKDVCLEITLITVKT